MTKKTSTKRKPATKKSRAKKAPVKKVAVKKSETSSQETETTPPVVEEPVREEESVLPTRGEDVVILETQEGRIAFNTFDELQGKAVEMRLTRGINKVDKHLFDAFESDEFFVGNIIGGKNPVVKVISRPGKTLDDVEI